MGYSVCGLCLQDSRICSGLTFHRATTKRKKSLWSKAVKDAGFMVLHVGNLIVCSDHFLEEDFVRSGNRVFLKDDAVPQAFSGCIQLKNDVSGSTNHQTQGFEKVEDSPLPKPNHAEARSWPCEEDMGRHSQHMQILESFSEVQQSSSEEINLQICSEENNTESVNQLLSSCNLKLNENDDFVTLCANDDSTSSSQGEQLCTSSPAPAPPFTLFGTPENDLAHQVQDSNLLCTPAVVPRKRKLNFDSTIDLSSNMQNKETYAFDESILLRSGEIEMSKEDEEENYQSDSSSEASQLQEDDFDTPTQTTSALRRKADGLLLKSRLLMKKKLESSFGILRFVEDTDAIKFYTGFRDYDVFYCFYQFFIEDANTMNYLGSKAKTHDSDKDLGKFRVPKMTKTDEFFMTMIRLRRGYEVKHLGHLFGISPGRTSRIINTWLLLMADRLSQIEFWTPEAPSNPMLIPNPLKDRLKKIITIVDATEIYTERPSASQAQKEIFSSYKNHVTGKMLVAIDTNGTITFVSRVYAGRTSDKKLFQHCGIMEKLRTGDIVMADRGFDIAKVLEKKGVEVLIPDFLKNKERFSSEELRNSERIAEIRVHVERAIRKIKEFHILDNTIPITLMPMIDRIWICCATLANFTGTGYLVKP
ncbi:uncharacterized protein LOC132205139 [Neocloeon triangulifer]|uniref:uncharacterized protein LOC132194403 n=1 Tax=Neocloeon triangulifer TaxID=2078957 RepID=UPI00286F5CD3|nr:uncharacterized protein LOC132194403 [Neocloeon triangulifer]XP_059485143.1 uncharacterized protein LOC132202316 [Neocloeon triangulifer]XP_059490007.1 uncharacterized protein LOC132205139 [Neocloeon triangulifer]